MNNFIDARGMDCPKPLIMTKKAIDNSEIKDKFEIVVDNLTACENIERYLKDNGLKFESTEKGEDKSIVVFKGESAGGGSKDPVEYCPVIESEPEQKSTGGYTLCLKTNKMGNGPDELGEILMKALINTIEEVSPLPQHIVMYNSGVLLAEGESPLVDSLKKLENQGVKILICGTCADYFSIKDNIKIGIISNMYDIMETLSKSLKVIYP